MNKDAAEHDKVYLDAARYDIKRIESLIRVFEAGGPSPRAQAVTTIQTVLQGLIAIGKDYLSIEAHIRTLEKPPL